MSENGIVKSASSGLMSKSYWSKPDGKTAGVILAVGAITGGYSIIHFDILGKLARFAWNGVSLTVALLLLLVGAFVLTDKKVHYLFRLGIFHFTDIFITHIDPKTILKMNARDQAENLKAMDASRSLVDKSIEYLEKKIAERQRVYDSSMDRLKAAKDDPRYANVAEDAADEIVITGEEIKDDQENLNFLLMIRDKLDENYEFAKRTLKKITRRYDKLIRDRETMRNVRVGVMAGQDILNGGKNAQDVIDAEDRMVQEIANDVGYFKKFIRETQGLSDAAALQKKISMQSAMEKIKALESNNSDKLLSFKREMSDEKFNAGSGTRENDFASIVKGR